MPQNKIFLRFSGMEWNIICTTVSAEVMLSVRTHSCVMPTEPMRKISCGDMDRMAALRRNKRTL